MERPKSTRRAFTLLELLIVVAVVALLIGLVLAAVHQVRETAAFLQSQNNLRQIGFAVHDYAGCHSGVLPRNMTPWDLPLVTSIDPPSKYWIEKQRTTQAEILPYLEEGALYRDIFLAGKNPNSLAPSAAVMAIFQNPLDPTAWQFPTQVDYSCSYASNAWVFSMPRRMVTIRDGTSNTIFFTEHYRVCRDLWFDLLTIDGITRDGGGEGGLNASAPTFADHGYSSYNSGPFFSNLYCDFYPITSGNPPRSTASGNVTFQARPWPGACDPRMPQAASSHGLQVLMGDCSVRTIAAGVDPYVFWGSVTPARGELDFPDF